MIGNKFSYALVDTSFLLNRNLFVVTKDKEINEMNPGDVVKLTLQTLNRLARDWDISCDKIILIGDEWNKDIGGYYRTQMIKDYIHYKGSRKFMTQEKLEEMKKDSNVTPEEIKAAERELAVNRIKYLSKQIIKNELKNFGLPYFSYPGYEFDDIATMASFLLHGKTDKMNVIITKDSDLSYSLCPTCCQFLLPTRGSDPKIITYNDMYTTIPLELLSRGMSLYQYFSFLNSLGYSHNDTAKTVKPRLNPTEVILHILDDNYEDLTNIEAFKAQMNSFNLSNFPNLDKVQNMILNDFSTQGRISSSKDFMNFCKTCNIEDLSEHYYTDFVNRFDQKLFSK